MRASDPLPPEAFARKRCPRMLHLGANQKRVDWIGVREREREGLSFSQTPANPVKMSPAGSQAHQAKASPPETRENRKIC